MEAESQILSSILVWQCTIGLYSLSLSLIHSLPSKFSKLEVDGQEEVARPSFSYTCGDLVEKMERENKERKWREKRRERERRKNLRKVRNLNLKLSVFLIYIVILMYREIVW